MSFSYSNTYNSDISFHYLVGSGYIDISKSWQLSELSQYWFVILWLRLSYRLLSNLLLLSSFCYCNLQYVFHSHIQQPLLQIGFSLTYINSCSLNPGSRPSLALFLALLRLPNNRGEIVRAPIRNNPNLSISQYGFQGACQWIFFHPNFDILRLLVPLHTIHSWRGHHYLENIIEVALTVKLLTKSYCMKEQLV